MALRHVVAWATQQGKTHQVNQDAGGAWTWTRQDGSPASLLAVADGVSAGRTSEDASRLVVDRLRDHVGPIVRNDSERLSSVREGLLETAQSASEEIARRPFAPPGQPDATTLVAVACLGGDGIGVWCGDSRVYLVTAGNEVTRLTSDHSWTEDAVNSGRMTPDEAARDPRARMITRWLGPQPATATAVELFTFGLQAGDTLLCCTDGLTVYFAAPRGDEGELAAALGDGERLDREVQALIEIAVERGGHDDITVAALRVLEGE